MARAAFQVLVFPFSLEIAGEPRYLLFKRPDLGVWQGIAGGGEDSEDPEQAARRETLEEAGISTDAFLVRLDSTASIPATHFAELQGRNISDVPEFSFGVECEVKEICLSAEHTACEWLDHETAQSRLEWDSNRQALRELHSRLVARKSRTP
jgi:dATP pyrophosphohydrolase